MKVVVVDPAPVSFSAYTALAFDNVSLLSEPNARGSLQRPTRANWFPTKKSGFYASFSKREYIRTRFAPSSR